MWREEEHEETRTATNPNSVMDLLSLTIISYILLVPSLKVSIALDSFPYSQPIIIDGTTLASQGGTFELGFFTPGNSKKRYLGIWDKNFPTQTVVWVANRLNPINDSFGILTLNSTGSLVLIQNSTKTVWHTSSFKQAQNPVAELLNSGNLVVRDEKDSSPEAYLWQSFDYPIDTLLPNMKFGWDLKNGLTRHLTAWKSPDDQAPEDCDKYGFCGVNGICLITESPICQCLKGFSPRSLEKWNSMDRFEGCVRDKPLSCEETEDKREDGFFRLAGLKLPDTKHSWINSTIGPEECREKCLNNCSCTAYTNSDIRGQGSGCVMSFGNLVDIRQSSDGGQDLYIRMDASELEAEYRLMKKNKMSFAAIAAAVSMMLLFGCCYIHQLRRNKIGKPQDIEYQKDVGGENDMDLPLVDMSTISTATDNFSTINKIGQGGFGPVCKGRLTHGQEIAVKRLSKSSEQGMMEFINEVKLIAKLQHRNLIKLLGCCIEENEKLLVYEYMPNGSLDSFIFDDAKGKLLDWTKRFHIICGIARSLLYLHQDSRLRIIHRDLKASNVLLDEKLNPKISDFGMAKTFKEDQIEGNTNRVVGTCGYMASEYAINGQFSIKSDVFSFGILMLEIISGKKNRGCYHPNYTLNLIGHAWVLWKERRAWELIDENIKDTFNLSEVMRCIHVSLLCVQQSPEDRPAMSNVVLMLGSENALAEPKQPGFFLMKYSMNSFSNVRALSSTNEITISLIEGR